jgi:hypothetical protein
MVERSQICNVVKLGDGQVIRSLAQNIEQLSVLGGDGQGHRRLVVTPDKLPEQHPVLLALSTVESRLLDRDLYLIAASIFIDRGQEGPTPYHNDVWISAPFTNRVLQLWIPIACQGAEKEIERSMLRVDRKNKLEDGWGVPYGIPEYCQLYTGERRDLPFATAGGLLGSDPDVIKDELVGGAELSIGDVLCFDNSFCHYTLPSKAFRAALTLRLTWGAPTYNGYFLQERPLDGLTGMEINRQAQANVCHGFKIGDLIPQALLRRRGSFREYPRLAGGGEFADALVDTLSVFWRDSHP